MKGIQTVKGCISPVDLGITLSHEHIIWDQCRSYLCEPEEEYLKEAYYKKLTAENMEDIINSPYPVRDVYLQLDIDTAVDETILFKNAGGSTIVDVTSIGLHRDPEALYEISGKTGLNIVMGSGYYIWKSYTSETEKFIKESGKIEIADAIIKEFSHGVGNTGIKPGVIGEIGVSNIVYTEEELKVLKAAAIAQKETGAPLYIHPVCYYSEEINALWLMDMAIKEGADPEKIVICHCDCDHQRYDMLDTIAKRGGYIEFDQFGMGFLGFLGDKERIEVIIKLIKMGNLKNILISQDICFKVCLCRYGGEGYRHILGNILPVIHEYGLLNDDINEIMVENPKRLLTMEI